MYSGPIRNIEPVHCFKETHEKVMKWAEHQKRKGKFHPKETNFAFFLEEFIYCIEQSKVVVRTEG